ncbi:Ldh family oxidoreductase [Sulfuracidifex tepidarius]|nr:Ldh family oxidoreductase [Sulfuracidifex tepidarius]
MRQFLLELLEKRGVQGSEVVVDHFLEAEIKGHSSHGIQRMIPLLRGLDAGTIKSHLDFKVERETDSSKFVDGNSSIGIVVWDLLIRERRDSDVFMIAVRNSSHIGYLGYYTSRLASAGIPSIMFGNAEPSVVAPGTSRRILSTSPISIGIPPDVVLDMSLASTSRGRILEAKRRGERIPLGWAVGPDGKETDDPDLALKGGIIPIGGKKGFFLSLFLDMLTATISGSELSENVVGVLDTSKRPNKGEVLIMFNYHHEVKHVPWEELPGRHGLKIMNEIKRSGYVEVDNSLLSSLKEF